MHRRAPPTIASKEEGCFLACMRMKDGRKKEKRKNDKKKDRKK